VIGPDPLRGSVEGKLGENGGRPFCEKKKWWETRGRKRARAKRGVKGKRKKRLEKNWGTIYTRVEGREQGEGFLRGGKTEASDTDGEKKKGGW